jgi:hypothetical protein
MSSRIYRAQAYQNLWVVQAVVGSEVIQPSLVRLLVDTGASYTVLPSRVLQQMGCDLSGAKQLAIVAAGGLMQVPVVRIPWFSCLGQRWFYPTLCAISLPVFRPLRDAAISKFLSQWS